MRLRFTLEQINAYLLNKLNITDFQTAINLKADLANVYLKTDLYTKTETTTALNLKADSTAVALKQNIITGLLAAVLNSTAAINRVLITSSGGLLTTSTVLSTELAFLSGITSNIQAQLTSINAVKTNQTYFITLQTLYNTLNTSVSLNRLDLDALSTTVKRFFS